MPSQKPIPKLNQPSIDLVNTISQTAAPVKPTIVQYGDRYIVLCGNPLTVNGILVGKVYLSQDITTDRLQLTTGINSLIAIGILAICLLTIAISQRIRTTLKPLAQMSQIASNVSADDLGAAKLDLARADSGNLHFRQSPVFLHTMNGKITLRSKPGEGSVLQLHYQSGNHHL